MCALRSVTQYTNLILLSTINALKHSDCTMNLFSVHISLHRHWSVSNTDTVSQSDTLKTVNTFSYHSHTREKYHKRRYTGYGIWTHAHTHARKTIAVLVNYNLYSLLDILYSVFWIMCKFFSCSVSTYFPINILSHIFLFPSF